MSSVDIVITGTVKSGKTAFIRSLAEGAPISSEATFRNSPDRTNITVSLDVGRATVANRTVSLLGTPGQEQVGHMRGTLINEADGIVLLVPADRDGALTETQKMVASLTQRNSPPLTLGVTRTDLGPETALDTIRGTFDSAFALIECIDPRNDVQCRKLLEPLVLRA